MRRFIRHLLHQVHLPFIANAEATLRSLRGTGRSLFLFFTGLLVFSTVGLLYSLQEKLVVAAPARGGSLNEGIVGSPRFINPVLAISDADRDVVTLVYSGLMRATPNGTYEPDLAQSYTISEDGKTYVFTLREGLTFHDGVVLTAQDVVFTVERAQDAAVKSPLRANWDGVVAEALDDRTVRFTLRSAYSPFIENATLGILPKHLWENVSAEEFPFSELNTTPVGSGPHKVRSIARSQGGIPSSYTLQPFNNYALGEPYLSLTLRFYQSESALLDAYQNGNIDAASGLSALSVSQLPQEEVLRSPLNRVFGVFFNQNQSEVLRDKDVRSALDSAIDRTDLVSEVLGGFGTPLAGPVPPSLLRNTTVEASSTDTVTAAHEKLLARGWVANDAGVLQKTTGKGTSAKTAVLTFSISTANVPELRAAAEYLRVAWGRMGARVEVKIFEQGDLSQNVIRARKYDALLFGEVVGRELDLFAFWHSSQRNDPGLNIAAYANATVDDALEGLRTTSDAAKREQYIHTLEQELKKDIPAVFLYAPDFVYSIPKDIQGLDLGLVEAPSDRFLSVTQWHREVDYVWPLFARKQR